MDFQFAQFSQVILMLAIHRWKNGIINSSGLGLDCLTSSAGYRQITNKPTHAINGIDLIFCTNLNVIFKHDRHSYF